MTSSTRNAPAMVLAATIAAACMAALPVASQATSNSKTAPKPRVGTGAATRLVGTTATLTGTVEPAGSSMSYYFQWGKTTSYGSQTPTVNAGSGTSRVKASQSITGLVSGVTYHFRIVGQSNGKTLDGHDRQFVAGSKTKSGFELPKKLEVVVGSSFILSGAYRGPTTAHQPVQLQGRPYPFKGAFVPIGAPAVTDPTGRFAFRIANLTGSTQMRVVALGRRHAQSRRITVDATVAVTLHVKTTRLRPGLVRLYGTVKPAVTGAYVFIEQNVPVSALHKRTKSGAATTRFLSRLSARVLHGNRTVSRFSVIANVGETGNYRAYIKLLPGPIAPGFSRTVLLHAGPHHKKKKEKKVPLL